MKMFVLGEKIADEVHVDVHGLFVEGQSFTVQAGTLTFPGQTKNSGYPALGTGQIVGDRLVVNLLIDGAPHSVTFVSGDADHSRWMLSNGYIDGLAQKAAA
jgi:hypothetical protein